MSKYIIRLDDASPKINKNNWDRIESLLLKYSIKPLVGIIPNCLDSDFDIYNNETDDYFWNVRVNRWKQNGWELALHGFEHVFKTSDGGINPMNKKSEFAGVDFLEQKRMIREGIKILNNHYIYPRVFFAPAHTFDLNTLKALTVETDIRFISDTPAFNSYKFNGFTFVPQQAGRVRHMIFPIVTFCYHPNEMQENDFAVLESFICKNFKKFISFPIVEAKHRKSLLDRACIFAYFLISKIRSRNKNNK